MRRQQQVNLLEVEGIISDEEKDDDDDEEEEEEGKQSTGTCSMVIEKT